MHPAQILTHIGERGFRVAFDRATKDVDISPTPNSAMAKRILANEAAIVGYLNSLPNPPALAHSFTVGNNASEAIAEYGVCVACGIPWAIHGEPPTASWKRVGNVDSVKLVVASPIEFEATA